MYSNYDSMVKEQKKRDDHLLQQASANRFLFYFQHGSHWFQDLAMHKNRDETLQSTVTAAKDEIQRLHDKVRKQHVINQQLMQQLHQLKPNETPSQAQFTTSVSGRKQSRVRRNLHPDQDLTNDDNDLLSSEYEWQPSNEEILYTFASLAPKDAVRLLGRLIERSAELQLPQLGETFAIGVDILEDKERRNFLRDFFRYVPSDELQEALCDRDEYNDSKRWENLIGELKDALNLDDTTYVKVGESQLHSDEARITAKIHAMVELLEDISAEVSFLDETRMVLSPDLMRKLTAYETPTKRIEKARELMARAKNSANTTLVESSSDEKIAQCGCYCGKHRLIHEDDDKSLMPNESEDDQKLQLKSRRKAGRRKNAVNFGSRVSLHRNSSLAARLFPLAEVCHLITSIIHLKFSRDLADASLITNASTSSGWLDDRWEYLRHSLKPVTFKTLVKDYLVRKYGIKSIAVMHTMQLERSLVHYSAFHQHIRCDLFSWFIGVDKLRLASKDFAFRFFQQLLKNLLRGFIKKPTTGTVISNSATAGPPYSSMIALWTEYIGDGEVISPGQVGPNSSLIRFLTPAHAMDACNLSFPVKMKEAAEFTSYQEKLYRLGMQKDQLELESFFRSTMDVWQSIFDSMSSQVVANITQGLASNGSGNGEAAAATDFSMSEMLDDAQFARCLAANAMELTTGERLQLFDLLTQQERDDDTRVSVKTVVLFLLSVLLRQDTATAKATT